MRTNFDCILDEHNKKFSHVNLHFDKTKIEKQDKLLLKGLLVILLIVLPCLVIAVKTNNLLWFFPILLFYIYYFLFKWFWINPTGINMYSDKNVKFSFKDWVNDDRIKERVEKMKEFYNNDETNELRVIGLRRLEITKSPNFKKIELIILGIVGIYITRYYTDEILYKMVSNAFNYKKELTIEERTLILNLVLLLIITIVVLYHFFKMVSNQKWADEQKKIKNLIKDMDDITLSLSKRN